MGKEENAIKKGIMATLSILGIKVWNTQSGMVKVKGAYMHLAEKNTSDIIGYLPYTGRILAIEAKKPDGLPTQGQIEFLAGVNKAHGVGLLVDDIDRFQKIMQRLIKEDKIKGDKNE